MTEPKYRYFLVPPARVPLAVRELVQCLPPGAWSGTERDKQESVTLPASELFETNTPRIRLSRLRDLLPGCIRETADAPESIALPVVPLVLAYRPETRREELPAEVPEPPPEPPTESPAAVTNPSGEKPADSREPATPTTETPPAQTEAGPPPPLPPELPRKPVPAWKRLLKPKLAPPPAATDAPPELPTQDATPTPTEPPPTPLAKRRIPADHEPKLRALFMTEDDLTVGALADLIAKLPGIAGCELLTDSGVAHSTTMPETTRPSEWIAPAREAIAKMPGLPAAMPVITLHPASAAVSMWLPATFTLLVAHEERGFPPGVREKIDTAAAAIERVIG